jgi:hypothetical protein
MISPFFFGMAFSFVVLVGGDSAGGWEQHLSLNVQVMHRKKEI